MTVIAIEYVVMKRDDKKVDHYRLKGSQIIATLVFTACVKGLITATAVKCLFIFGV